MNLATRTVRDRALWFSAAVLGVVLTLQIGLPERTAQARPAPAPLDVATSGDYTMLTLETSSEDLLVVLDGRNESLFFYHVKNKNSFEGLAAADLRALFANGRRIGSGGK